MVARGVCKGGAPWGAEASISGAGVVGLSIPGPGEHTGVSSFSSRGGDAGGGCHSGGGGGGEAVGTAVPIVPCHMDT